MNHEIGLSTDVLESGLSLASLRPVGFFQQQTRLLINQQGGGNDVVLRGCKNPISFRNDIILAQMTMIKYGGDMLRQRVYTKHVAQEVEIESAKLLGWGIGSSICSYEGPGGS